MNSLITLHVGVRRISHQGMINMTPTDKNHMRISEPALGTTVLEPPTDSLPAIISELVLENSSDPIVSPQEEVLVKQTDDKNFDVVIIGGGPGGYVAAIRAAQLGGKVAVIEKDKLGGVCLNRGCIPTKAMLASADAFDLVARRSNEFGVKVGDVSLDFPTVIDRREKVVKQLVSGVGFLMKKHNIQVINGTARLLSRNSVEVSMADGKKEVVEGRNIIIATGSEPAKIPVPGLEGENVWDSDGALHATEVPKSLLIIGGGVIGIEWGYMFKKFGSDVTIVELMPQILPQTDSEVAAEMKKVLERQGLKILTNSQVTKIESENVNQTAFITSNGEEKRIEIKKIMVAVGRKPLSSGIGLEDVGVSTDRGFIKVNERMQTDVPGIYAIGDVVGGMLLAHKASEEGVIAAENCMGHDSKMSYDSLPSAVYTTPGVATVGISEDEAKEKSADYKVGKFPFRVNGKALGIGERDGFVKFIADAKYGEILGCHMIGPHVTDLIHEVVVGMDSETTIEVLGRAIHGHPTLSEVVKEAALDAMGEAIHKG